MSRHHAAVRRDHSLVSAHEETGDGETNVEGASDAAHVPAGGYRRNFCDHRSLRFDTRHTANASRRLAARHQTFESAARHRANIEGQRRAAAGRIRQRTQCLMYGMDRWLPFLRPRSRRGFLFDPRYCVPIVRATLHAALKQRCRRGLLPLPRKPARSESIPLRFSLESERRPGAHLSSAAAQPNSHPPNAAV
jgi:hypothetical protein